MGFLKTRRLKASLTSWFMRVRLGGLALLLGTLPVLTTTTPAVAAPPYTYSRYITTLNLYQMGCNQGRASDAQGQPRQVVVLDFGKPVFDGTNYGTIAWPPLGFVTIAQIETATKDYMQGFWDCTAATSRSFMNTAVGTSNCTIVPECGSSATTFAHGQAWSQMVGRLRAWIFAFPPFRSQLAAWGASDMELNWDTVARTTDWANGFNSVGNAYFNFGDAAGCPPAGVCNNSWTQGDIYNVSWGIAAAYSIPEIYNGPPPATPIQAQQWQQISLWGVLNRASAIAFSASMSQYQACVDRGDPCAGANNTPDQSWTQLQDAVNSDARTSTTINWSTEMSWQTT